jgi:histidinol dehydrogenase
MGIVRCIKASELDDSFFNPRESREAEETVKDIIRDVRTRGDGAVLEYGGRFDGIRLSSLRIERGILSESKKAFKKTFPDVYDAVCFSRDLALEFARKQRECFFDFETELLPGLAAGQKIIPVDRAGIYIPAGRFPLLSSAVMTICPAIAAGVREVVVCTAPKANAYNADPKILASVSLCAESLAREPDVFAAGGAQAVAAMAYGTESIPPCPIIVGPGNKYVAEAKRQIFGRAGIDLPAGPTEVLVIADGGARADYIAADMLAQSEHDSDARAVLLTPSADLASSVIRELEIRIKTLSTEKTARESLEANGLIVVVDSLRDAADIADKKAPEHLELAISHDEEREWFLRNLRNYGSLFIGHRAAEVLGDYSAGLNHTLPTSGAARFTGGLSVKSFLKIVTTLRADDGPGTEKSLRAAAVLGRAEGLDAHAAAAEIRLNR